jgi:citronellol/citronellal dehydrogenase
MVVRIGRVWGLAYVPDQLNPAKRRAGMGKLDGKVVVVTGASRGIGADIARLFAAEGGRIVCAARTLREGEHPLAGSLETTVAAIRQARGEATAITANISEPDECEALIRAAREIYGPVDVLVNNAALTYYVPVKDFPTNRWLRSWAVNLHAPFILSKLALEDMIPRRRGSIVNISSGAAVGPGRGPYRDRPAIRGGTCYGAEKAALERFTQGLAEEVYEHGISVTAVSPSQVVPTPGTVHHRLVSSLDDPRGEPPVLMAKAALLLATAPLDAVTGRVTYSQQILKEFGWIDAAKGRGVDASRPGSGYSQI